MNCKNCNTRMPAGGSTCFNCGWTDPGSSFSAGQSAEPDPNEASGVAGQPALSGGLEDEVVDLELDAETVIEAAGAVDEEPSAAARAKAAVRGLAASAQERAPLARSNRAGRRPGARNGGPTPGRLGAVELRALLAEEPELLEAGLAIYSDDAGQPVGVEYPTDVGPIDVLARDADGGLVLVLLAEAEAGEALVAEVLKRVGWVRKHLGKGRESVRAIVLLEPGGEDLSYAAAAVAGTVAFKHWRLALSFEDVEV